VSRPSSSGREDRQPPDAARRQGPALGRAHLGARCSRIHRAPERRRRTRGTRRGGRDTGRRARHGTTSESMSIGEQCPGDRVRTGFPVTDGAAFLALRARQAPGTPAALRPESTVSVDSRGRGGRHRPFPRRRSHSRERRPPRRCQDLVLPRLAPSEPEPMRGVGGAEGGFTFRLSDARNRSFSTRPADSTDTPWSSSAGAQSSHFGSAASGQGLRRRGRQGDGLPIRAIEARQTRFFRKDVEATLGVVFDRHFIAASAGDPVLQDLLHAVLLWLVATPRTRLRLRSPEDQAAIVEGDWVPSSTSDPRPAGHAAPWRTASRGRAGTVRGASPRREGSRKRRKSSPWPSRRTQRR
jgi:hypothetical protein